MKLDIKAFTISCVTVTTVPLAILFIWCAANSFGIELVNLFEKIHPSGGFSLVSTINGPFYTKIPGILINTLYTAADAFIFSFLFCFLYNKLASPSKSKKK